MFYDFIKEAMQTNLAGIETQWWVQFLKLFDEKHDETTIMARFEQLAQQTEHDTELADEVMNHVSRLMEI